MHDRRRGRCRRGDRLDLPAGRSSLTARFGCEAGLAFSTSMRSLLRCGFWFFVLLSAHGAVEEDLRGKLVEKVICAADPAQSYALYVPSAYTQDKNWPVIYCFDPGAR